MSDVTVRPSPRHRLHAVVVAALAALVAGALLAPPARAATAGGTCQLVLPARIVVHDIVASPVAHASGSCTEAQVESEWSTTRDYDPYDESERPQPVGYAAYSRGPGDLGPGHYGTDADVEYFPGTLPWGRLTFYPAYAGRGCTRAVCRTTYVQNVATTDVRLATRSALAADRQAGRVTLSGASSVFSISSLRYRPHAVDALFQARTSDGSWHTLRRVRTSATGRASMTVRAARSTRFRLVTRAAAHWWTSVSPSVIR